MDDLGALLTSITERMSREKNRGRVADYIPKLAKIDPNQFSISVALADGQTLSAGDADTSFSIQSVSKVFALSLALTRRGADVWKRVGREPSGDPFNSIVQLKADHGIPRNPLINSDAIVISDIILAACDHVEAVDEVLNFMRNAADDENIFIDPAVAKSEQQTGFRNAALANFIKASHNIDHAPEKTLALYFNQCAIAMSCSQLAQAVHIFAFGGRKGVDCHALISSGRARRVNSLMLTCGHYDGSGDFAFQVGLPGKSGVGGGILAIAPGIASIAVWSPGLNKVGNSHLGTIAMEDLAVQTG
ncbi:MAG: glutaminase [Rhodospirillales bacterium]